MLTVARGEGKREFFGFDTFCQHSCEPSMETVYESEDASRPDLGVTGNELCGATPTPPQPRRSDPVPACAPLVLVLLCMVCAVSALLCLLSIPS